MLSMSEVDCTDVRSRLHGLGNGQNVNDRRPVGVRLSRACRSSGTERGFCNIGGWVQANRLMAFGTVCGFRYVCLASFEPVSSGSSGRSQQSLHLSFGGPL